MRSFIAVDEKYYQFKVTPNHKNITDKSLSLPDWTNPAIDKKVQTTFLDITNIKFFGHIYKHAHCVCLH